MAMGKPKNKDLAKRRKKAMAKAKEYFATGGTGTRRGRTVAEAEKMLGDKYEGLDAMKREVGKYQKKIDAPSTFMKNRVSTPEDKKTLEGGELSEGSRIHTGRGTRKMTKAEGKAAARARSAKAKRLSSEGTFRRRDQARENVRKMQAIKELVARKKKKTNKYWHAWQTLAAA